MLQRLYFAIASVTSPRFHATVVAILLAPEQVFTQARGASVALSAAGLCCLQTLCQDVENGG